VPTPVTPEATATTTPPQLGSEIERLRLNWRQVIEDAPEDIKKTSAIAILRSAGVKPVAFEGDIVVLAFRYPYHKEKIEEPENQRITQKVISNFLGRSCHVRCIYEPEADHLLQAALKMGAQITSVEEK
jgi:DNA polymerase-3 subunit gamma/tau